jgi:hypothetical protein
MVSENIPWATIFFAQSKIFENNLKNENNNNLETKLKKDEAIKLLKEQIQNHGPILQENAELEIYTNGIAPEYMQKTLNNTTPNLLERAYEFAINPFRRLYKFIKFE